MLKPKLEEIKALKVCTLRAQNSATTPGRIVWRPMLAAAQWCWWISLCYWLKALTWHRLLGLVFLHFFHKMDVPLIGC